MEEWSEHPTAVVSCFSNIVWEWIRMNQVVNLPKMMEDVQHQRNYYSHEGVKRVIPFFIDNSSQFFWQTTKSAIRYCMWVDREVDKDGFEHPSIFLKIQFDTTNPNEIVDHVEWIKQESERICNSRNLKQQVLVSMEATMDEESTKSTPSLPFMVHEFHTTSSFDNFFSEEAASVRAELETFLNGKAIYERIGRPWNYSILNTGSPGVGKTKLVKAIAALTGRTLIVLNLQHITSPLLLQQVFHASIISGIKLPHEKRLYYIPEVDTQLLEVAKKREKKAEPVVIVSTNEKQEKQQEPKPSLTLGDILNVLDGVPERNGHILVLDTNRLEELDPALIRPGRIDRMIEWKKSSAACTRRMIEHFYQTQLPSTVKIPDQKWSAAELHSIFHQSATMKEALRICCGR